MRPLDSLEDMMGDLVPTFCTLYSIALPAGALRGNSFFGVRHVIEERSLYQLIVHFVFIHDRLKGSFWVNAQMDINPRVTTLI